MNKLSLYNFKVHIYLFYSSWSWMAIEIHGFRILLQAHSKSHQTDDLPGMLLKLSNMYVPYIWVGVVLIALLATPRFC